MQYTTSSVPALTGSFCMWRFRLFFGAVCSQLGLSNPFFLNAINFFYQTDKMKNSFSFQKKDCILTFYIYVLIINNVLVCYKICVWQKIMAVLNIVRKFFLFFFLLQLVSILNIYNLYQRQLVCLQKV